MFSAPFSAAVAAVAPGGPAIIAAAVVAPVVVVAPAAVVAPAVAAVPAAGDREGA